jgi:hypothetical protein
LLNVKTYLFTLPFVILYARATYKNQSGKLKKF